MAGGAATFFFASLVMKGELYKMLFLDNLDALVGWWRDWHTRWSQKPVPNGLRVRVPPSPPARLILGSNNDLLPTSHFRYGQTALIERLPLGPQTDTSEPAPLPVRGVPRAKSLDPKKGFRQYGGGT